VTAPFDRILLATEHTEFDAGAERVAFGLAGRWAAPLLGVLPIVSTTEYMIHAPQLAERADADAFSKLTQLRGAAKAAGLELDIRARHGQDPAQEIIAEALEREADLVVARRRGRRGFLAKLMVGEMVSTVATHAPCSVLLVPRGGQVWSTGVVVGVDASDAALRAARTAATVAASADVPLSLASVAADEESAHRTAADAAVAKAVAMAREAGARVEGQVLVGRPEEELSALATRTGADLIVVGRTGEAGLIHRLLLGGTARRVIGHASSAVLVVGP